MMGTRTPALIRLVAGRYRELHGLATIADAAMLLLFAARSYWTQSGWHVLAYAGVLAAYLWVRFTWVRARIDAYYASRCGRVASVPPVLPVIVFFTQGMGSVPILRDMYMPLVIVVPIALLLLAGPPAWIVLRDRPYRLHWLPLAIVGVVFAFRFTAVTTMPEAWEWSRQLSLLGGVALALAGAFDHALLLGTLRQTHELETAAEPSNPEP